MVMGSIPAGDAVTGSCIVESASKHLETARMIMEEKGVINYI